MGSSTAGLTTSDVLFMGKPTPPGVPTPSPMCKPFGTGGAGEKKHPTSGFITVTSPATASRSSQS